MYSIILKSLADWLRILIKAGHWEFTLSLFVHVTVS